MDACDVLIVGGGPAGSTCATHLVRTGLDVVVMDRAQFPRDKVCAGWITPQVIETTGLDIAEYRRGRTFQPIRGFRTGAIGLPERVETAYGRVVSFGIRRVEFDHYLLQRSGARLQLGVPVSDIRRDGAGWIINNSIRTPMLVGAGGHFCPVARFLNGATPRTSLVVAQEAEFPIDRRDPWTVSPELPELYFSRDLAGYGWCFRKQAHINIGIGRIGERSLPRAASEFVTFLRAHRRIPAGGSWSWRGHAYLISEALRPVVVRAGVLLAGDAAGLAYPESGEGIRPAIESGLLAARTIIDARGDYSSERLASYERSVQQRFLRPPVQRMMASAWPSHLSSPLLPWLLGSPWLVRHVVLDRWFLHSGQSGIAGRIAESQNYRIAERI
jgi:flavin-dependent dehydrogenase